MTIPSIQVGREEVKLYMNTEVEGTVEAITKIDRDLRDKVSLHEFAKVENRYVDVCIYILIKPNI